MPVRITDKERKLSQQRLRELLNLNPATGTFTWRMQRGGTARKGAVAGCLDKIHGYWMISVDGLLYYAHRLVWLYVHGIWPTNELDHINGKRADNRLNNLREASRSQQGANALRKKRDLPIGVYQINGTLFSMIRLNGKSKYLGSFRTVKEASAAYCAAKSKYHGQYSVLERQQ